MTIMGTLNDWFEGLDRAKIHEEHLCDKCGLGSHGDFPGAKWLEYHFAGKCIQASEDDMNSLQLLVIEIDANCCVVKVEKGDGTQALHFRQTDGYGSSEGHSLNPGAVYLISKPFDQLKAAFDDAPVPRLQKSGDADGVYYLVTDADLPLDPEWLRDKMHTLYPHEYAALSQLAGHPLPIWEGGKWEMLFGDNVDGITPDWPFKAWRYTR